jgi:Ca-activated chloride channel family protein
MTFEWPVLLLAVLLVPAGILAARAIDRRRRARVGALAGSMGAGAGSAAASTAGVRAGSSLLDRLPAVLVVLALLVLVVALARPTATVALPRLEGTLMLVFDVSGSMAAEDVAPNRMEKAKAIALDLVQRRPEGVVIGVVAFSDAGVAVQAPTSDTTEVEAAIARLIPTRGTSLGSGILAAVAAIDEARADTPADYYSNRKPAPTSPPATVPGSDASTLIVVLSDGENNADPDPAEAAVVAGERGIRIASIGVGTAEGDTLDLDGFLIDTRLDEAALRRLADLTAGSYVPATEGDPAGGVYTELARQLVIREEPVELTAIASAAALLLLVLGVGLSLARSGRLP